MKQLSISVKDLTLLLIHVFVLGAIAIILMTKGPSVATILLATGATLTALAKIGHLLTRPCDVL
jgi:hypothetical protein